MNRSFFVSAHCIALLLAAGCATEEQPVPGPDGAARCAHDDDCSGGRAGRCDVETGVCVECVEAGDCTDPGASRCGEARTCVPCDADAQCAHLPDTPVCDEGRGTCVACTPDTEAQTCGDRSCDPATFTCGAHDRGSRRPCESCISDSDCLPDHRCIPMEHQGEPREQAFCLKAAPGCEQPFSVEITGRESASGAPASESYCGIHEEQATCEAVRALIDNWFCERNGFCKPDPEADEVEVPQALCREIGVLSETRCTYRCGGPGHCPDPLELPERSTCGPGETDGPSFCGG